VSLKYFASPQSGLVVPWISVSWHGENGAAMSASLMAPGVSAGRCF